VPEVTTTEALRHPVPAAAEPAKASAAD
jgi:hypothetical protein